MTLRQIMIQHVVILVMGILHNIVEDMEVQFSKSIRSHVTKKNKENKLILKATILN